MPILAPGAGTGYTSISDYLDANQGTLANESSAINAAVNSQLDAAKDAADAVVANIDPGIARDDAVWLYGPNANKDYTTAPGYKDALDKQIAAQQAATNLNDTAGLSDALRKSYGVDDPQYTANKSMFDARLLGLTGGFGDTQARAKSLGDYLSTQANTKANLFAGAPLNVGLGPGANDGMNGAPGGSDARHNRPRGEPPPPPPPDDVNPFDDPTDVNHGPEDAPIDNQNPWGGGGG